MRPAREHPTARGKAGGPLGAESGGLREASEEASAFAKKSSETKLCRIVYSVNFVI